MILQYTEEYEHNKWSPNQLLIGTNVSFAVCAKCDEPFTCVKALGHLQLISESQKFDGAADYLEWVTISP